MPHAWSTAPIAPALSAPAMRRKCVSLKARTCLAVSPAASYRKDYGWSTTGTFNEGPDHEFSRSSNAVPSWCSPCWAVAPSPIRRG